MRFGLVADFLFEVFDATFAESHELGLVVSYVGKVQFPAVRRLKNKVRGAMFQNFRVMRGNASERSHSLLKKGGKQCVTPVGFLKRLRMTGVVFMRDDSAKSCLMFGLSSLKTKEAGLRRSGSIPLRACSTSDSMASLPSSKHMITLKA